MPTEGNSWLCASGNIEIFGTYERTEENNLRFTGNWTLFCQVAQFRVGDLFAIKVQGRPQYIKLLFEWVRFRHMDGFRDEDESNDEDGYNEEDGSSDEVDEFMEYIY